MTVVLLGPQRFAPSVAEAAEAIGVTGPIALVTAGWQGRESEDGQLSNHLGGRTVNLCLRRRADDVFRRDPEFTEAYRARQRRLRQLQDFYRIRLEHLIEAARIVGNRSAPADLLGEERQASIDAIRALDRQHLQRCRKTHHTFRATWNPASRPAVAEHREEIAAIIGECDALAIAGGHVASLLNRLWLFGIAGMLELRPVLAWSAGAMAVTEHVVLFHDSPPQGRPAPQLLDGGLALVEGVVALPNPRERLDLLNPERMAMYARRFRPATCLTFPRSAWVVWEDGRLTHPHGVLEIEDDGSVIPLAVKGSSTEEVAS